MTETTTIKNDTLDRVAFRVRGSVDAEFLKAIYAANPHLAEFGPVLPARVSVLIPDAPQPTATKIHLWD